MTDGLGTTSYDCLKSAYPIERIHYLYDIWGYIPIGMFDIKVFIEELAHS